MQRGLFSVYKPAGITSVQVANIIKEKITRELPRGGKVKVGHGGTLDESAEGVLVIGVGDDCKRLHGLLNCEKEYKTVGSLGQETTTLDYTGVVVKEMPWSHVTRDQLLHTLESFKGTQRQYPPMMSAIKVKGRRLSDIARCGDETILPPVIKPREITITNLELIEFASPEFKISVTCSKGTYIRKLVSDIGIKVGSVAHVKYLQRVRVGSHFNLNNSLVMRDWTLKRFIEAMVTNP